MKHIEKKFLNQIILPEEARLDLEKTAREKGWHIPFDQIKKMKKLPEDTMPIFSTFDNKIYKGFQTKINNEYRVIPEPDPILVYFDTAYFRYIRLEEIKKKLINITNLHEGSESIIAELYDYFGTVSIVIILLFTAIEATMNRCIPENYEYKRESKHKTEIFTKEQIEDGLRFDEKMKLVIPEITGRDFQKKYDLKYQHIINLKTFRDEIVHTKSVDGSTKNYTRAFNFNYKKTIEAVKDFCNFYLGEELINDCPCSNET